MSLMKGAGKCKHCRRQHPRHLRGPTVPTLAALFVQSCRFFAVFLQSLLHCIGNLNVKGMYLILLVQDSDRALLDSTQHQAAQCCARAPWSCSSARGFQPP